jgi:YVTN family beta-propeller protein
VIENLRRITHDDFHRGVAALEIGDQNFDLATGDAFANGVDGEAEEFGAAVFPVVAVNAGDHRVLEAHEGASFGDAAGLVVIDSQRAALLHRAETAAAGADVTEDHESRGAAVPTFAHVGAGCAFADCMEFQVCDESFELTIVVAHGGGSAKPLGALHLRTESYEHYFYFRAMPRSKLLVMRNAAVAGLLMAGLLPAQTLLVLSKGDHTLAMVDPATMKVLAKMPSGEDPHEVEASSDGKFAYISNYGGGAYNTITVADLVAKKTVETIDLGALRGPHGLMFAEGKLWFTAEAAKAIGSYDPTTKKIDWILGTGQGRTHMIYVTPGQKQIVTSNVSAATMTIIEKVVGGGRGRPGGPPPQPDWNETVVGVGRGAEGFDVAPGGVELWAANAQDGTISILNLVTKKVTETLNANVGGANRLKFTPDGKHVFVSTLSGPDVIVIDASTRKEIKRIKVGTGAAGIQMEPDGSVIYVACTPDSYVAIIDPKTLTVTGHLDAGKNPDGMAWAVRN